MNKSTNTSEVGIIVPTLNRPDFVVRQLNYYANLNFPHPIYYADSSNAENAKIIKDKIEKLKSKLNIIYLVSPVGDTVKSMIQLLSSVQEKYVAYVGDDDYWVPDTLNQCVEFLEKNPDYEAATGKSVMFRMEKDAVYGKIKVIYDYPKYPIENNTASERLFNYLGPKPSTIAAAVARTKHFLKYYQDSVEIKDFGIRGEFLISCLMPIAGKYKVIDKLGYVMQLHNLQGQRAASDTFEWVINNENWYSSYTILRDKVVAALMAKDGIDQERAELVFKQSMWFWMKERLRSSYRNININNPSRSAKKSLKTTIATRLPLLKKVYREFIIPWLKKDQLHYEVTKPGSKYYKDFKAVVDSLTKLDDTH